MKKGFLIFILFKLFLIETLFSQIVEISVQNQPLNQALIEMRSNYGLEFSFNDNQLAEYMVSLKGVFPSPEEALNQLLKNIPLEYKKRGNVYLIYYKPPQKNSLPWEISLQIKDIINNESLPFSDIIINEQGFITDFNGSFTFKSLQDSIFEVTIASMGYYMLDTVLSPGKFHSIYLTPVRIGLKEIVIKGKVASHAAQTGYQPAEMHINHRIATFLPGSGDASVFNLLRLQPGIVSAGEQTNDLLIWGAYTGQSKLLFDGFTLYGMKNFNDNISYVNPFMTKDIQVFKGAFNSSFGNRVGGIVNISGINGNTEKASASASINANTINTMVSIPVSIGKSSLTMAYRRTYYNLFTPEDFTPDNVIKKDSTTIPDYQLSPDYHFQDANIKLAGSFNNRDEYNISCYRGNDQFNYDFTVERDFLDYKISKEEKNEQTGVGIYYGKYWQKIGATQINFSVSELKSRYFAGTSVIRQATQKLLKQRDLVSHNNLLEYGLKIKHQFINFKSHQIDLGTELIRNTILLKEDSTQINMLTILNDGDTYSFFGEDNISIGKKTNLTAGLRMDYPETISKWFIQPRASISTNLTDKIKINFALGKYNQFITQSTIDDDNGNYRYIWSLCNNETVPVLKSFHEVAGISFIDNDFTINIEGYHKNTSGLTRYFIYRRSNTPEILYGESRSKGLDMYIKKEINGSSFWISYSLAKTEEKYLDTWVRALHDQRHEIKLAALFDFNPFYFSANFVYGSGFPFAEKNFKEVSYIETPYNRTDVAIVYRFNTRLINLDAGVTILNLFNTTNIRYDNLFRVPSSQTNTINIHTEAVSFTPGIFLNISF